MSLLDSKDFSGQNKAFLDIATNYGFGQGLLNFNNARGNLDTNKASDDDEAIHETEDEKGSVELSVLETESEPDSDFNKVLIELLQLQEDIGRLQLNEQKLKLSEKYLGLSNASSMAWLKESLDELSTNLTFILENSKKIQLKLANPDTSNSLPLHCSLHETFVKLTNILIEINSTSDRSVNCSSWLNSQNWEEIMKYLSKSKLQTEKLVSRLRTSSTKLQIFSDNILY